METDIFTGQLTAFPAQCKHSMSRLIKTMSTNNCHLVMLRVKKSFVNNALVTVQKDHR